MKRYGLLVLTVLLGPMAGCASDPLGEENEGSAGILGDDSTSVSGDPLPQVAVEDTNGTPLFLGLNECVGIASVELVPREDDASPPSGWAPSPALALQVSTEIYSCQRFSIGPFERSNVSFVVQTHDNQVMPSACAEGLGEASRAAETIHLVVLSDAEIATFLAELGIPVQVGEIRLETLVGSETRHEKWTVSIGDGDTSWLQRTHVNDSDIRNTQTTRRFWDNSYGGVSFFEFQSSWRYTNEPVPPVLGQLQEPFLRNSFLHAGLGPLLDDGTWINAPISHFGDSECTQPTL